MQLDLTQLPYLLSLPCVITSESILTETPMFTTAKRFDETVYILTVEKGECLSDYLRRVYNSKGPYDMDCSVYAQLASAVLSGKWPIDGGKMFICIGADFGDFMLWNSKIDEMGYIGVPNPEVSEHLAKMATPSKGQWCIRISQDEYLGLGSDGPHIFPIATWVKRLRSGLIAYTEKANKRMSFYNLNHNNILIRLLDIYIKMGSIDKWAFFPRKGYYSVSGQWTEDEVIVTENTVSPLRYGSKPQITTEERTPCLNCGAYHNEQLSMPDHDSWSTPKFTPFMNTTGAGLAAIARVEQYLSENFLGSIVYHDSDSLIMLPNSNRDLIQARGKILRLPHIVAINADFDGDELNPVGETITPSKRINLTESQLFMMKVVRTRHERKRQQRANTPKHVNRHITFFNKNSGR